MGAEKGGPANEASFTAARRSLKRKGRDRVPIKSREWIIKKKERAKRQGLRYVELFQSVYRFFPYRQVKLNSKYTGRKRKPRF